MKKILAFIMVVTVAAACLFGCAMTENTQFESTMEILKDAEKVTVHLYNDGEESLQVNVDEQFLSMLEGSWEKASGRDGGDKVLTVTVGTQHEITFFDNGRAMIYYGKTSVLEKDRAYYTVALDGSLESLYEFCSETGTAPETEN